MGKHIKVIWDHTVAFCHALRASCALNPCVVFSIKWSQSGISMDTLLDSTEYTQERQFLLLKVERPQGWRFVHQRSHLALFKFKYILFQLKHIQMELQYVQDHKTGLQPFFNDEIKPFFCLALHINKPFLILYCNWKNMWLVRVTTQMWKSVPIHCSNSFLVTLVSI